MSLADSTAHMAEIKRRWVAESAYYRAVARGLTPGLEFDDWLYAENEFAKWLAVTHPGFDAGVLLPYGLKLLDH